ILYFVSAGGSLSAVAGRRLSDTFARDRLFRFHYIDNARDGLDISDARDNVRPGADRHYQCGVAYKKLETCSRCDTYRRGSRVADRRYSEFDAVRYADDGTVRCIDRHCMVFRKKTSERRFCIRYAEKQPRRAEKHLELLGTSV